MITYLASASSQASISPAGVGMSLAAAALLAGIAIAMHHRKKSPRIIGWICFLIGIPLAGLLSGLISDLAGLSLWSIPVSVAVVGYVGFVFLHDGLKKGSGNAHRWLQPVYGLILPALLLTLGGGLGHGARAVMTAIDGGVGSAVSHATGK